MPGSTRSRCLLVDCRSPSAVVRATALPAILPPRHPAPKGPRALSHARHTSSPAPPPPPRRSADVQIFAMVYLVAAGQPAEGNPVRVAEWQTR
ncbi:protein of unknown function [Streptantibioticus cattleyicolor NRRL 8057 = DSM 46488]|nr:protein of unknown function [Streptantibioticus cattleyicolor NRRL 8057 = DSM 46488]